MCLSVCCRRDELFRCRGFFFGCRLRQKEIERERERKTDEREEKKKENIFATACLLAFDSRRRLVKRGGEEGRKQHRALSPLLFDCSSIVQVRTVEIESPIVNYKLNSTKK